MTITVANESELVEFTKELVHISTNLLFWDRAYAQEPCNAVLVRKLFWHEKADELFTKYNLSKTDQKPKLLIRYSLNS